MMNNIKTFAIVLSAVVVGSGSVYYLDRVLNNAFAKQRAKRIADDVIITETEEGTEE